MKKLNIRYILFIILITQTLLYSQGELGKPPINVWMPKDYGAATQNWGILQDDRGVMYFANGSGVLEYDGVEWRTIALPNSNGCFSLKKSQDGRIYVGAIGEIGYIAPDSVGEMHYVSLLPFLPEDARRVLEVRSVHIIDNEVFFKTQKYLIKFTPTHGRTTPEFETKIWRSQKEIHTSFVVDGDLYLREIGKGLLRLHGDSLKIIPGGEQFADERIYVMLPYDELESEREGLRHRILVGTRTKGLLLFNGQKFKIFKTEVDDYLRENLIYSPGVVFKNGNILFSTLSGGAVVINHDGKLIRIVDRNSGLPDNSVFYAYADPGRPEAVWLALNVGIARVEVNSPLSIFDATMGLESGINRITRFKNRVYIATGVGISYLDTATATFKPVSMPTSPSWDFQEIDGHLISGTNDGVYTIKGDKAHLLRDGTKDEFIAMELYRSGIDSNRIFVGLGSGIASLYYKEGTFHDEGRIPGIDDEIRAITVQPDSTLWAGSSTDGVFRITFLDNKDVSGANFEVEHFNQENGLPPGSIDVGSILHTPYFNSADGFYRFDRKRQYFVRDSVLSKCFPGKNWIFNANITPEKIWLNSRTKITFGVLQKNNEYSWKTIPFQRYEEDIPSTGIYYENNGLAWLGNATHLYRYDTNIALNDTALFHALIRRVLVNGDSTLFGGATSKQKATINYNDHNLTFLYSATAYEDPERLSFQTRLEGFERNWSPWSKKTEREYTNLPEGSYQFQVRATNAFKHISTISSYQFTILPPWYRTFWAYSFYAITLAFLVFGIDRLQRKRLTRKEREQAEIREAKLRAETAEAKSEALQAENQRKESELKKADELKDAYKSLEKAHADLKTAQQKLVTQEKLASLGQLTAGIAHEIKNPLNFVNNFAELSQELIEELQEEIAANKDKKVAEVLADLEDILNDLKQNATRINEHGKRADSIVKSMLQHSRGKAGERQPTDINALLNEDLNLAYHGMRAQDSSFNITIAKEFDENMEKVEVVPQDISRVFLNIITNGFYAAHKKKQDIKNLTKPPRVSKDLEDFTPILKASTVQKDGKIEIRIRDNGLGMPEEIREKIFQPFFTTKPSGSGTGLGLSISHDIIVQEHNGEIKVESKEGEFTEFVITLPR